MLVILITVIIEGIQVAPEARGEVKGSLFVNSGVVPAIGVISFGKPKYKSIYY